MAKKKKGKDPAFMMYSGDFLSGTFTMTMEQRGKYVTLMCIQHQKGYLTSADMKSVLNEEDYLLAEKFYKADDGNWYNQKMTDVINERKEYTANRLRNFNKGNDKDNDVNTHIDNHKDSHMELHTGDEDEDENQDINQDKNEIDNEYVVGSEEAELEEYYQEAYLEELNKEYTKADRQDMLADVITGSLDKEQKQMMNKFDNLFGNEK
jgi:uncharacterized protein YdaU (DUF1376 family)